MTLQTESLFAAAAQSIAAEAQSIAADTIDRYSKEYTIG